MNRIALLLRKDVLVLRRSPLLLGILIAYPLAIALLIGLVASYGSSKPRVAFVDEDNLPATVVLGGKRFDVGHTIDEASKKVKLVRLSPEEAKRQLDDGRVVAVVTVPPGFISTLRGMVRSPQLELQLSTGTISSRVEQQVQALVYTLNRQLQRAWRSRTRTTRSARPHIRSSSCVRPRAGARGLSPPRCRPTRSR